jgi:hypothetical protein
MSPGDFPYGGEPQHQEHQEKDKEHGRKELRDCEGCAGNRCEAEHRSEQTDYEERQGPTKHGDLHEADCLIRRTTLLSLSP